MKQKNNVLMICVGLFVLASLMLTGCASGPRFSAAPPPATGKARVYVYRNSSFRGAASFDIVYVNDDFRTPLRSGGYATCEVSPGTVVFYVTPRIQGNLGGLAAVLTNMDKEKYEKLRIEVEAGKTYYVNLYVQFWGGQGMKLVDEAAGAKEISSLELEEP